MHVYNVALAIKPKLFYNILYYIYKGNLLLTDKIDLFSPLPSNQIIIKR